MWAAIKTKLLLIGSAAIGILYALLKYQKAKADRLEVENKAHELKDDIQETMKEVEIDAEKQEIEAKSDIKPSDWRSGI